MIVLSQGQARHRTCRRASAGRALPGGPRSAHRRAAARDRQAGRHPGRHSYQPGEHRSAARHRQACQGDSRAPSRSPSACATTGAPSAFDVRLEVDPDRANLAGVTNLDVAAASAGASERDRGFRVCAKATGKIPIVARLCARTSGPSSPTSRTCTSTRSKRRSTCRCGRFRGVAYGMKTE